MSQFSWSIIGLGDSDDDNTLQIEGLTPAIGTVADASAAIGAAADVALSARAPAALGGETGPADTNTKQEEKPTVAASALVARGLLAVVPTAKRTRTAVETLDEHRLHRLWWFDIVPVTLRMRAQNSSVSLCFPDTEPENIDGWLSHCNRIIRRWSPSSFYYIGITADPVRRFLEGHSRNGHGGYDIMDVIAAVASSKESARIERGLLARHREHPYCENTAPGGESPTPGHPHYVYVVARTGPMRSHRSGNSRRLTSGILSDIAFFGLRARRPMEPLHSRTTMHKSRPGPRPGRCHRGGRVCTVYLSTEY